MKTLDSEAVERLRRHWEDGWNHADIDTIMTPFAQDVVFSSPGIAMMTRDPQRTSIHGYDALRSYIEKALSFTSEVRYATQATYAGTDSLVIVYTCGLPDGAQKPGADLMRVDADGKVIEWRCHY